LAKLTANGGQSEKVWGPYAYPDQTEVTDVAIARDGTGYIVTGHGDVVWLTDASAPAEYYGRFTRVDTSGKHLWTQKVSLGKPSIIYTECFSIQPMPAGKSGWVASCGSGIEGTSVCQKLSGQDKTNCMKGIGDSRVDSAGSGAPPRNPGVWVARIVRLGDSTTSTPPDIISDVMYSYVAEDDKPGPSGSSAAEFISPAPDGGFYITTDEEFGAGFLKIGKES